MWQESPSARKLGSSRSHEVEAWTRDYWLWVWWFFSTSEKHVRYKTYQNLERWKLWNTKYESLKKPSLRSDHHGWHLVISLLYGSITHIISNTQSKSSIFDFHLLKWSSALLDGCKLIYSCITSSCSREWQCLSWWCFPPLLSAVLTFWLLLTARVSDECLRSHQCPCSASLPLSSLPLGLFPSSLLSPSLSLPANL